MDEIKKKYANVYEIKLDELTNEAGENETFTFHFKKPGTTDFGRFIKESSQKTVNAMKNLVNSTIVEEEKAAFDTAYEKYPGIIIPVTNELLKLLGASAETLIKKL